jgi:hypothetical protein
MIAKKPAMTQPQAAATKPVAKPKAAPQRRQLETKSSNNKTSACMETGSLSLKQP